MPTSHAPPLLLSSEISFLSANASAALSSAAARRRRSRRARAVARSRSLALLSGARKPHRPIGRYINPPLLVLPTDVARSLVRSPIASPSSFLKTAHFARTVPSEAAIEGIEGRNESQAVGQPHLISSRSLIRPSAVRPSRVRRRCPRSLRTATQVTAGRKFGRGERRAERGWVTGSGQGPRTGYA